MYTVKVENPIGLRGLLTDGLEVDAIPVWVTEEGSLGVLMDSALGDHYTLEVDDGEGQDITFSVISGSLPTGITLDSNTGIFSGDADDVSEDIDFTFEVQAVDTAREPHEITRTFSITVTHRLPIDLEMWSGYCSSHGQASSWNTYCADVTEWDTTNGKISVNSNGTFTVNEGGYYRINSFAISNGGSWAYTIFYVNGAHKWHGHDNAHGDWSDGFIDVTWKFNPGDTFYIRYHNPGSYAYHSGNVNGAYSRMQVQYMGPLTDGETLAHKIWSGWCSSHGQAGGWNTYCTNTSEFNSFASDELTINSNGTFTVQKDGYYRVHLWVISNGSNYAHMRMLKNGDVKYYGHEHADGTWTDNFLDQTWAFETGDTLRVDVHNPSSSAYHYGRSDGVHSKMQVSYVGPLVMDSEPVPFTWSGYCSTNGAASGYNKYCTDTTEWDNLDGMLEITDDGTFTVNQPGYYRINAWTASEGNGVAHARLQVNGQYKHHGYERVHGNTSDNFMDLIWPLDAGDEFYVEYNNPGTNAYVSGNTNGAHSRLQIEFIGDF